MKPNHAIHLMVIFTCVLWTTRTRATTEVKIGGLFGGESFETTGQVAFRLAIDYINQRDDLLPNITLTYYMNQSTTSGAFHSLKRACDLVQHGLVAVIGPATTSDVKAVSPILSGLHIPHTSPFATDPTLSTHREEYPFLFKMSAPDSYQAAALVDILKKYSWTKLGIIASSTDYGRNGMAALQTEALKNDWTISSISYFYPSDNLAGETLIPMLNVMKNKGTRIVVLNCLAKYARIVLDTAFNLGMLSKGWAWINTDGVTVLGDLYSTCVTPPVFMYGLIGTRPISSRGELTQQFNTMWSNASTRPVEEVGITDNCATDVNDSTLYAKKVFDAVLITAYGIHDYLADGHALTVPQYGADVCQDVEATPWADGERLASYIAKASGDGVSHYLNFTDLQYTGEVDYDVVNLRKNGWIQVGEWTSRGELDSRLTLDEPILFSGMTNDVPKDTRPDLKNITLRVVTIIESPFTMVNRDPDTADAYPYVGLCLDMLTRLSNSLGFKYELYVVPDGNYGGQDPVTGEWNGMVGELTTDTADLAVAPLTITYERQQAVDFTKPFQDLGSIILMAKESPQQNFLAFLDPFSATLWIAVGAAFLLCGLVITLVSWISPYGKRGKYSSRLDKTSTKYREERNTFNLWNSLWYAFSAWAMQGADVSPRCLSGRLVYGAWYFATMIISATYTANLAAFLTVQRLDAGINNLDDLAAQKIIKYGTLENAAVSEFFRVQVTEPYLTIFSFMEQYDTYVVNTSVGLQMVEDSYGKPPNERYVFIFDSIPLEYAASKPPCNLVTIGRLFNQFGYGLALGKNSPYVDLFSLEILRLRQSGFLSQLQNKWVTSGTCNLDSEDSSSSDSGEQQATVEQLAGVFMVMVGVLVLALCAVFCEYCVAAKSDARESAKYKDPMSFCDAFSRRCRSIRSDIGTNFCMCAGCTHKEHMYFEDLDSPEAAQRNTDCDHRTAPAMYSNDNGQTTQSQPKKHEKRGELELSHIARVQSPGYHYD